MITLSKTLVETIFVIGSLLTLAVSSAFAIATIRAQLAIGQIQLEIKKDNHTTQESARNIQLAIKNDGQQFARKVQQNIDRDRIEIGILKCEIADIRGVLERELGMKKRPEFPKENIPPETDFT